MKKIAIITATRAEYGLLTPLIRRIDSDEELELDLIVTGAHLSEKQGHTIQAIHEDGFIISHEIPILEDGNTAFDVSLTMANAVKGFAECFRDDRPDMVVILGDRTEMLGVAAASMNERIPISHISGGEVTEGAVDDCVRHALTKMGYLHFTSTEVYRNRVIQLGESPDRVYNVGALGAENILGQTLLSEEELKKVLDIQITQKYALVTFHPVTQEDNTVAAQVNELCASMKDHPDIYFVITASNADTGGDEVNRMLRRFCDCTDHAVFRYSLGVKHYLSAVKYASFVLGNSSSGITEAPILGTPAVNIGDRQKGRLCSGTVINVEPERCKIDDAIFKAVHMEHVPTTVFGNGGTSEKILKVIKKVVSLNNISLKKRFYDIGRSE